MLILVNPLNGWAVDVKSGHEGEFHDTHVMAVHPVKAEVETEVTTLGMITCVSDVQLLNE